MSARTSQHQEKLLTRLLTATSARVGRALSRSVGIEPAKRSLVLDELEQRVLYSATPVPVPADVDTVACVACEVPEQIDTANEAMAATQLVVVDADVADYETLVNELAGESGGNFEVVMLDGELDGIEQLTDLLNERTNVEALHIVSHGEEGKVRLGSSVLSNENLAAYSGMFAEWDNALTADADILFYGCDLGGSAEGQELIQSLSILTGADIAASDDQTGHVGLGGDWELEVGVGEIQTEIAFSEIAQASWYGVLATAPSLNISSGATTTVDTSVAMADTSANFTISADGSVSEMEATLSVDHGSLTLSDTDDVTLVSGEWFAGSTMTVRGSVVAISNAMQDLVYTPDTDWSGTAVVSASIDDLIGGAASDSLAITVVRPFVSAGTTTHADSGLGELNRGLRRGVTRSISTDADGRSVAAWTSGSQSYWEVFDSDGSSLATGTFAGTDPRHVSVAMDPSSTSGSFVATWTVGGAGTETIEIQRFDLTGATSGAMFRPTLAGVVETNPSIAMNAAGDYGVVWESGTGNLRFERFGSNDLSIDGGSVVVPESAGGENPAIGIDGDRNILISWDDGSGQYVSRYDGTFNKTTLSTETFASGSSIGMNDAGEAVIAWHYSSGNWNIDGQRMAADGSLVGSEFFVPAVPSGDELNPSVSIDQAGNFAIAWEGDNQIQMRQFAPNGTGGSDIRVDSNSVYDANASVSAIDAENVVVLYTRDGGNPDILSRRFTSTVSDFEDPEVFFSQPTVTALSGTTVSLDALLTDADTQADSLSLAFSSSRPDIVDATLITESGGDALRTLSMPVAAGVSGTATITVTVSDGNGGSSTSTFDVVAVAGIQVTTTADEADGDRSSIAALLANPGGTGISLREAIEAVNANANAGVDSITFDLAGSGAHVITVVSGLPDIETPIDLDATGQAGRVILDGGGIAASGLTLGEDADGSTISGLVIRDFGLAGITIKAGSDGSVVQGNRIGSFDDSGAAAAGLGNGEGGIEVLGSNNLIGGAGVADGNVLSGNGIYGVQLQGTADLNQIVGNFIGTNETGSVAAGNTDGIRLIGNASNTTIDGNVISGNADYGITLFDDVNGTQIVSNQIGTGSDQTSDLGNGVGGVRLIDDAANNMVGGSTATANTIAFNSGAGISAATNTAQNTFRFNKIYSNSGLGIDLEDDDVVETNDGTDSDPGANGLQNYPELYAAEITGGDLSISGQIDSTPNSTFDIDFYVSSSADATGHGEGERHIGTVNVTTDSGGNASITQTFSGVTMSAGEAVSGTATDAVGNTSEFGQNVIAVVNPAPVNATPGRARVEFNGSVEFSRATGNQIRIMDADAGVGVLKVELTATHGTFSLGSTSSVAFGSGDGTDDSYIEVFGTLDQLNQAFDGLVFTPTADYSGRASLVLNTDDQGNSGLGGAQVDVDEIRIEVGAELQTRAEFTINQSTTGNQRTSSEEGGSNNAVAILADGSYVVVWTDDTTDGNGTDGVYGRILAPDGTVRVDEFRVATSVAGEQRWASVAADAQGRFVVTWTAADADADGVYMRRFNLDGTPIDTGDVAVNTTTTGVQWNATVAINASGNGMIVWEGNGPGDSDGVFGRLLSVSSGLSGAELRINVDQTGNNHNPAVTVNDGGDFVVVWERDTDEIVSRSLPGGALTQPELVIATGSNFTDPVVAMSHDGDFVVAYYIDKTIDQVEYVAVSAAGSVGSAVTLPTSALTQRPGLATDGYGEYVLAYRDQVFADVDIEIIRFAAEGDVLASAEAITINSGSGTNRPSVDMSDSDNFIVVWDQTGVDSDGSAIVGQAYGSLVESRLVTSTTDDGSASGVNFTDGAILSFGGDALSLETPTTAGDLSVIVEAGDLFAPDADIDALHVVGRDMLVGTGDSSAQLRKGDILFTLDRTATSGPLELTDNDVAVARPIEGTTTLLVFILFDDIDDPIVSGMRLRAFTLVEQDTLVGDTVVQAGNLLFTPSNGGGRNKNIYVWETEDVFEGTTTGSATLLIDGAEFGIDEQILGMELFEESIEIGGRVVGRGSIALTTNNSVSLFSAEPNDVFAIVPTTTNLGSGVAAGTGYLLFDGSDVGFSNGQTELDALAITGTHINHAPVLTSRGPSLGITNEDTTSSPIDVATILDTSATDSDYDFVGMAITSATGLGTWEYSLDGVSWTAFGSISDNSSLLLDGAGQIRYIPNGLNGEAPRIVYRAWDQTVGLSGERIDTTVRGGNTAFSDDTDTAILTVTDVNDAPTVSLSGVVSSLAENTSTTATTKLADIVIADDGTGTNTPSLSGVDSASFTLIGSELHLRSGITLDFEDQTTYSVTITIDDGTFSDSVDYTLSVTDVNEAPTLDFTQTLFSIDEDRSTASVIAIGDIVLSDDALGTNNLSLIGTDAGSFNIVGNSVVLRAGVVLDYESQTAFNVSVVVDDPDIGTTSEVVIPITLTVNDVNDVRPVIQVGQSFSIPENLVVGDGVGTVVATDVDTVGTLWNWTIESGDTGGVFQINSGTGEITIADASNLDFENTQSYTLQISVSDGGQTSVFEDVDITVTDVNDVLPVIPGGQSFSIGEDAVANAVVGTVLASDADTVGTLVSWAIHRGNDDGIFQIATGTGEITIADPTNLDFESADTYTLEVSVSDGVQSSIRRDITITINDVDDESPVVSTARFVVSESDVAGFSVGTVTATDVDSSPPFTNWQVVSGDVDGLFSINSATGVIQLVASPDYELRQSYVLTVSTSDGVNTSAPANIAIDIQDENDNAPIIPAGQTLTIAENATAGTVLGTVAATDVDSVGTLQNWQILSGDPDGIFAIDPANGTISVVSPALLDFETQPNFTLQVGVSDGIQQSTEDVTISVQDDTAEGTIAGTIWDDLAGDGAAGQNNAVAGVRVDLYRDNGDDWIGSDDTFVGSVTTTASGYSFIGLEAGRYYVVVDSTTVSSTEDATPSGDLWAEQTWGSAGSLVRNTFTASDGGLYGGRRGQRSDDASSLLTAEHVTMVDVTNATADASFGFSFNVVTNVLGGDDRDDDLTSDRTIQGSLRQFILNANAIVGSNAMRFVPRVGATSTDADANKWWTLNVTEALPTLTDDDTSIDGTAWNSTNSVRDTNSVLLGRDQAVGLGADGRANTADDVYITQLDGVEFEIVNDRSAAPVAIGLDVAGDDISIRRVAISGFGDTADMGSGNIRVTGQDVLIVDNVLGSLAGSFDRPDDAFLTASSNIAVQGANNGVVRRNLIGYSAAWGIKLDGDSDNWNVASNEFVQNSLMSGIRDAIDIQNGSGDATIEGNYFGNTGGIAIDMYRSDGGNIIVDNMIRTSGRLNVEVAGVRLWGTDNVVRRNVITANSAPDGSGGVGVIVVGAFGTNPDPSIGNTISRNFFGDNQGPAIDLVAGGLTVAINRRGDGDSDTPGYDAQSGNTGMDAPEIQFVTRTDDVVSVEGISIPGAEVEIYQASNGTGSAFLAAVTADVSGNFVVKLENLPDDAVLVASATDADGNTSEFGTAIGVNLVPQILSGTTFEVAENETTVSKLEAHDANVPAQTIIWSIVGGADASAFTITTDGTLSFVVPPDFELPADSGTNNIYNVTVAATDSLGAEETSALSVSVLPTNDNAPVFTSDEQVEVPETRTNVLTVRATDADLPMGDIAYSIVGGIDEGVFAIDGVTGQLSFRQLMDFDRGQQTFVVNVAATDAGGQQTVQVVRVQLTDVNDEAPQLTAGTLLVAEDANDGTVVGRVTATDLDTVGGPLRFEIQPGGLGVFDIDSSTGDLIVANSSGLDHEVSSEIEVTVEVSDGVNSTIETLTVRVGDENESPTGIELGSNSFSENAIGVVIGDLTVLDVDSGDTHTFEVDDQRFEVVAGTLQLRDDVSFDYESDPTVTILVTATDEDGLSIDQTFELTVLGINEAPVGISITNDSIRENVKGGRIGRLAVADEDVADRHAFSVNDSRFEIVDAGLRLKPGIALDFETEQFVDVEITAVDQDGLSIRETIRIDVENRTIQVTDTLNRTVEEDTPAVTWDLSSVFEDDAGDLTFEVDSTSELGRLKLVGTKLVFQPRANAFGEERIRIVATASDSEAAVANLLLEISPVNDAPVATGPSSTVVLPGGLTFNPLAAENAFDIDDNSLTAVVVGLPQNGELTVEADGRFTYVPNEDFSGADVFSYEVRDAAGLSSRVEIELTVGGVGFQPQTVVEDAVDSSTESGATDSPLDSSVDSEATVASDSIDQPSTPAEAPPPSATSDQEQKKNIFNPLLQESGDSEDDQELVAGLIPLRGGTRSAEEAQRRDSRGDILGGSGQGSDESSASSESRAVAQSVVQQQARILSKKTTTQLDQALDNVTEDLEKPRLDQVVFGTASVSLGGFSVGYIIWLLRGGSLVASMLTSIPAWRMIDPLPVLDLLENSDEDGDSLDTLIDRNQKLVSANSSLANQEGK